MPIQDLVPSWSQVGQAGLGICSFLKCCRRSSRKAKKKKEEKKSQGLAKVFSHYQPLWALLSGVWEASQAELWSGMELVRDIWDAGFELG